jgi:hypothetical protein
MLEIGLIEELQNPEPGGDGDRPGSVDDLTQAEIKEHVRACERWYALHEASFAAYKGQYLAVSFKSWLGADKCEMRNIAISPSSLEVNRTFERRFGNHGGFVRRIGDPLFDF